MLKIIKGLLAVVLLAGLGYFGYNQFKKTETVENLDTSNDLDNTPLMQDEAGTEPTTNTGANTYKYKDGTFGATGNYTSPGGLETVKVSLTIKDDIIVDGTFLGTATNPTSKNWQGQFSNGWKTAVIGKNIGTLSIGVTNGSSLTPVGFTDALNRIKAEAKI